MENSDEELERLAMMAEEEPVAVDEDYWIEAAEAEHFQQALQAERAGQVRARPPTRFNEAMGDDEGEIDTMEHIMATVAEDRGVTINDLDGHFELDALNGTYTWVDHEDVAPTARRGTMGSFNKRIKREGGGPGF